MRMVNACPAAGLSILVALASNTPASALPIAKGREACISELERRPAYRAFLERDAVRSLGLAREAWTTAQEADAPLHAAFAAADTAAALALDARIEEALPWFDTSQKLLEQIGKLDKTTGRLHAARAVALYVVRQTEVADREMERALKELGKDDWDAGFARLAWNAWWSFDLVAALDGLREPLERARDLDGKRLAAALMLQGRLEGYGGGARRLYYEEAIRLFQEAGDRAAEVLARRNIGVIELRSRALEAAEQELTKALELAREIPDARLEFIVLNDLSIVLSQSEQADRAIDADARAETLLEAIIDDVRAGDTHDDLTLDLYNLMGLRYQSMPNMLLDPFPVILEQLALRPEDDGRICKP